MNIKKFKIHSSDIDKITVYLSAKLSFEYRNHSDTMSVLADEEFYFRNNSTQLNMVILKVKDDAISLDVIGGAGGSGLFNINLWSEKGYIKRVRKHLSAFAEENNVELQEF